MRLQVKNKSGYYEIRLESIGGLGANMCGKMLGELGLKYLQVNSAGFSSYGSEKTGTPVRAYIRYSDTDKEIRVHSPITNPHLLCVFHDALLNKKEVFEGNSFDTIILINTEMSKDELKKYLVAEDKINFEKVFCVPAQRIAMETHSRINVVMLGAMAKVMGFAELEDVKKICKDTLGKKYPTVLNANLEGITRGYNEVVLIEIVQGIERRQFSDMQKEKGNTVKKLGYETAPIGGINTDYGNSITNDLSPSRQGYIPLFIQERCINCGLCDSTCPDMVFQFAKGEYKCREMMVNRGLDYYHCKGCLRCVEVCPTQALVKGLEAEHKNKKWFLPNQDMIRTPEYYEKTGADGYITSESYLTEKRIEGGEI